MIQQDTIRPLQQKSNDSLQGASDSVKHLNLQQTTQALVLPAVRKIEVLPVIDNDTASFFRGNPVTDITYNDSTSFVRTIDHSVTGRGLFTFSDINRIKQQQERNILVKSLREGISFPADNLRNDWSVPLILVAAFLFAVVRTFPGNTFSGMIRFLTMRGINETSSRDTGVLFQWQSTVLNAGSFISIALFGWISITHFGGGPDTISGFTTWLILFAVVITGITLRHIVCTLTGRVSGEEEIFREYMIGIYHTYRAAGIILLAMSMLILYTTFLPAQTWIIAGSALSALLYILRVIRLFLIFMTRHVSILYLILYLCALEILPVVITVKYVTGLV